jgi:hypothetical protein
MTGNSCKCSGFLSQLTHYDWFCGQSHSLLKSGVIEAADKCSQLYSGQGFKVINEHVAEGQTSVDYIGSIGVTVGRL